MDTARDSFVLEPGPDPHLARTRALLRDHPQARALIGPSGWSAVVIVSVTAAQFGLAAALAAAPLPVVALVAWFVGAHLCFAAFTMVHEASHGLIFRGRAANRLIAYLANLSLIVPFAERFIVGHIQHHAHIGEYARDLGMPRAREAAWVGGSAARKLLWLWLHPLLFGGRVTWLLRDRPSPPGWFALNIGLQVVTTAAVVLALGWTSLLYLALSWYFSAGPHPVAIRMVQEHVILRPGQHTNSYYGPWNLLVFNLGLHNEHHDLPTVAWHRLPALRRMAPEYYEDLASAGSWLGTWSRFIVDPRQSLWDRTLRDQAPPG
jgi:sphingolipid delta-4 desaturase